MKLDDNETNKVYSDYELHENRELRCSDFTFLGRIRQKSANMTVFGLEE